MRQLASILFLVATSAIHRDDGTDLLLTGQPLHSRVTSTNSEDGFAEAIGNYVLATQAGPR